MDCLHVHLIGFWISSQLIVSSLLTGNVQNVSYSYIIVAYTVISALFVSNASVVFISLSPHTLIVLSDEQPLKALELIVTNDYGKTKTLIDEQTEKQLAPIFCNCEGN